MTEQRRIILGIGGVQDRGKGHDASASLMIDGKLVAAIEEERFSRIKMHFREGYPIQAIRACLNIGGITMQDVTDIGIESRIGDYRHFLSALRESFGPFEAKTHLVAHHIAHLASAVFASPFSEGCFIMVDAHGGMHGNGVSTIVGGFQGHQFEILEEIWSPYSIGLAWVYVTRMLGLNKHTDAGKVMALASFSQDRRYFDLMKTVDSTFISVLDSEEMRFMEREFASFEDRAAIAHALQHHTEICMKNMATRLREHYQRGDFCLAGGVALNSVANGQLLSEGFADRIFIQPAAGDSGLSLGAAYYVNHITYRNPDRSPMKNAFLGTNHPDEAIESTLKRMGVKYQHINDRYDVCAKLLHQGKILGWFQGRMEYGPRALGNRSILTSPFGENTKETLNSKVKHRESFRPFAACVLQEEATNYFTISDSPYMLLVGEPSRKDMPAITHVDQTTRLQTVTQEDSNELHALLHAYKKCSGVPILLNTSLNIMGEPIIESPEQAVTCWLETEMDALCIGSYLLTEKS